MKVLVTLLVGVLLLAGCWKSNTSGDDVSEDAGADTSDLAGGDADGDSDGDIETDTDSETGSETGSDTTHRDSDSASDMDTEEAPDTDWTTDTCFDPNLCGDEAEDDMYPCDEDCWWISAIRDGITCVANNSCPPGGPIVAVFRCVDPPVGPSESFLDMGVCECRDDEDCNDGLCVDGICGPSFCNGYWKNSGGLFGGCGDYSEVCGVPAEICADTANGYPGYCCEGNYPTDSTGLSLGGCSASPDCLEFQ